jgi:C1A family cysteine protease
VHIKTKKISVLMAALILTVLISNIAFSLPIETQNNSQTQTDSLNEVTVVDHKITSQELAQIQTNCLSNPETEYTEKIDGHGTGFSTPTLEDIAEIAQNAYVIDSIVYTGTNSSVDNTATPWFPPIGNQDGKGSCVAWAVGYYVKTYQEAKEHNWDLSEANWEGGTYGHPTTSYQDKIMSPDFIYSLINGGVDQGANYEEAIDLVAAIGVSSWAKMPYVPSDITSWPSEAAWTEAPYYRTSSSPNYEYLYTDTEEGLLSLKNWLAAGNLAVLAIDAYQFDAFTSQDVLVSYNFSQELNHANTIVGYDDSLNYTVNGETHFGAFKIANSWGIGGWENVEDGCYWLPYEIMLRLINKDNPVILFNDLINYQPELTASFKIEHKYRGECTITLGCGISGHPLATKLFSSVILGGNKPFCPNNIVVDITEFKQEMTSFYNQPFFLNIYDNLTKTTGTVTYFAVGDSVSYSTPLRTRNYATVSLSVTHTLIIPALTVTPRFGFAGQEITLQGTGFTADNTVNLTYLNPITNEWGKIADNIPVLETNNFTYTFNAPDLNIGNPAGDHPQTVDNILFAAIDNGNGYKFNSETAFAEYRKGLTVVGDATAESLFGNNTDLSSIAFVQSVQSLIVCGRNFNSGTITAVYDGIYSMGSTVVGEDGTFNATFTIPNQASAGQHTIILSGVGDNFTFTVKQLPKLLAFYDGNWKSQDFDVPLSVDGEGVLDIYYRINAGENRTVRFDGQPHITVESGGNTLEYWGIWINDKDTIELIHNTLSDIKLDKTQPTGSMKINGNTQFTSSSTVTLTLTCTDALSGVQKMRLSNDGNWDIDGWEPIQNSKSWTITGADGEKTVYCQMMDNAGLITNFEASIILDTTKPVVEIGENRTVTIGLSVDFVADCNDQNGIENITWNFGDNTTTSGSQVSHEYVEPGKYPVIVKVRDVAGNLAETSITVIVEPEVQSTPSEDSSVNAPFELSIETSAVFAILFAVFGLTLIIIKFKKKNGAN